MTFINVHSHHLRLFLHRLTAVVPALVMSMVVCALEASDLTLDEVEVVAEQAEVQSRAYRPVSVLSREQIDALPVTTVADILQYLPGLDVRRRGANDAQVDVSMRGGTFDQVLVLINGVPLCDAQTGHYTLNLPVSSLLIERIEVLQGASTLASGTNAYAGAVNIVTGMNHPTRSPSGDSTSVVHSALKLQTGMNGLFNPAATLSAITGEVQIDASADYSYTDGYYAPSPSAREKEALANNSCRLANIYLRTRWRTLDVQAGAQYKDAGAGLFYGSSTDQFDATRTVFASARYAHHWGAWSLHTQAVWRFNHDHYEWHHGSPAGSNTHATHTATASLRAAYASTIGTTSLGLEMRNENIRSTALSDTNRLHLAYFASQTFAYHHLNASLTVCGHYNTFFGHHLSGGANIGYHWPTTATRHDEGSIYLNAQRALRLPTFTDLYYDAGNQLGNPDLKPETAWMFSIGGNYRRGAFGLSADCWYRLSTNTIDWIYVPDDTRRPYHAANEQRIHAAGAEITAAYRSSPVESQTSKVDSHWLRGITLTYAYTWLDLDLHASQSRYLDYLSHKLVLGIEHALYISRNPERSGVVAASWNLRWQKREGDYTSAEGAVCAYQPVLLLDGSLFWQNSRLKISAECTNITNRHYYDYGALLMPGAWAKISIEAHL